MRAKLIFVAMTVMLICAAQAFGQDAISSSPAPQPTPFEPVDSSFVPEVTSKVDALQIVSVVRHDSFLRVKIRNVSAKDIYSFRMAYYKNGISMLFSFIFAERTFLAPGEVYKYEHDYLPNSPFAREPLTFEAVLFEDGTGDGVPDKVKSLQDIFLTNRKELEHVIATLQAAIDSSEVETSEGLLKLQSKLSQTPDYMYRLDMKGIAGITLSSWKATAMHMVNDIQQAKHAGSVESVRESLTRIKDDFNKSLAKYPRVE